MMHFMSSTDSIQIHIIRVPEYFETLVNKYVVYHEIRKTIQCNAKSYPEKGIVTLLHTKKQARNTR